MSEWFEVVAVGDPRDWSNDHGTFLAYPVDLKDKQGHVHMGVEWSRKSGSDAPKAGESIPGTIRGGAHGDKLKVDWDELRASKGGGGSRSNGGGKSNWKPESQFDPEKVARMSRSAAQDRALRYLALFGDGFAKSAGDPRDGLSKLGPYVAWFEEDVKAAGVAAAVKDAFDGTEVRPSNDPGSDAPPPSDQDIPF